MNQNKLNLTQDSRDESFSGQNDKRRMIAPRKFNVVYDTSGIA
jgi:hypothetical protein